MYRGKKNAGLKRKSTVFFLVVSLPEINNRVQDCNFNNVLSVKKKIMIKVKNNIQKRNICSDLDLWLT